MPINALCLLVFDVNGVPFIAANIDGYVDTSTGSPVNASARIVRASKTGASMPGVPGITGGVEERSSSPVISLRHTLLSQGTSERESSEWLTAPLANQPGTLFLQTLADNIVEISGAPPLDDPSWSKIPLRVDAVKPNGDEISIVTQPATDELDVDITVPEFAGNNNGVALLDATADFLGFSQAAIKVPLTGPWYREFSGLVISDLTTANLLTWGDSASTGIDLRLNAGGVGRIRGQVFSPGVTAALSATGLIVTSRNSLQVGIGRDTDTEEIYITFQGERVASAAFSNATSITTAATDLQVANGLRAAAIGEFRVWGITPAEETVRSLANKPLDLAALPAGLDELYQIGTGSTWTAEINPGAAPGGNNSSSSGGSPVFGYGLLGQPGRDETLTFASAAGEIFGERLRIEDPASRIFNAHFEAVSDVVVLNRSRPLDPSFFFINDPAPGSIRVETLTGNPGQGRAEAGDLRFDFTGRVITDLEELLTYHLTTDGIGPVLPAALASPFVVGPVLDQPAGFPVEHGQVGVNDPRINVGQIMDRLCRAAGVVLTQTPAGLWQAVRVLPEPFASSDPGVITIRQVAGDESGLFGFDSITQPGVVRPNVQHTQSVANRIFEDPFVNPDIENATVADIVRSTRNFALAQFIRPQTFRDEFPGATEGTVVPGRFTEQQGAFEEASRRGFSQLALPNLRRFEITFSRVPPDGVLQLGARLVLISSRYGTEDGIPVFVTGFNSGGFNGTRTTGGMLSVMEMGRWRLAPDAFVIVPAFTPATIANIQGDPWVSPHVGMTSTAVAGAQCNVSFPAPVGFSATGEHLIRVRFKINSTIAGPLNAFTLQEGGIEVKNLDRLGIRGGFDPPIDEEVVIYGKFRASDLADSTGAGIEARVFFPTLPAETVDLLSMDMIYEYDR